MKTNHFDSLHCIRSKLYLNDVVAQITELRSGQRIVVITVKPNHYRHFLFKFVLVIFFISLFGSIGTENFLILNAMD